VIGFDSTQKGWHDSGGMGLAPMAPSSSQKKLVVVGAGTVSGSSDSHGNGGGDGVLMSECYWCPHSTEKVRFSSFASLFDAIFSDP
jgi:hypothetical protein